eukprot:2179963-Amphidinium_carterae.1
MVDGLGEANVNFKELKEAYTAANARPHPLFFSMLLCILPVSLVRRFDKLYLGMPEIKRVGLEGKWPVALRKTWATF